MLSSRVRRSNTRPFRRTSAVAAFVGLLSLPAGRITAQSGTRDGRDADRERLLFAVDRALEARDAEAIRAAVGDRSDRLAPEALMLPTGPLVRVRAISAVEVLYRGPTSLWSLRLRFDERTREWHVVTRTTLCPSGVAVQPRNTPPPDRDHVVTWTILQCWPLPA